MPNTFIKPEAVVNAGIGLLNRQLVLGHLVDRRGIADFVGKKNDTITMRTGVRVGAARKWDLRATDSSRNTVKNSITTLAIDVKLTDVVEHAVGVSMEELTLDIESFGSQIAMPQIEAIAQLIEDDLADLIANANGKTYAVTGTELDLDNPQVTFNGIRRQLNDLNVPRSDRIMVVGSAIEEHLLNDDRFSKADEIGVDVSMAALADARLRRTALMDIFSVPALPANFGCAFHRSAFMWVNGAPAVPLQPQFAAGASSDGIGLSWIKDYDSNDKTDTSDFLTLCGYQAVADGEGANAGKVVRAIPFSAPGLS